ncbi:MAG TPA: gamma-glutamyltransferase, partial [Nitrolancea sp.]|nr:gamma-glutamyltransferase [Nitrolancea sp.]
MQGRPTTLATGGMVATPHYLASMAGVQMLRSGGNALDAAIAANSVLTVVYPHNCSVGGDAFMMIWDPKAKKLHALHGCGRSASGATIEALNARGHTTMPERGAHPVTVPGAVHAWHTAHARFGAKPFAALFQDAIRYADDGFPVAPSLSRAIEMYREMLERQPAAARQYLPNGAVPAGGDILRCPDLASSFRAIAEQGPAAIYGGPIGQAIADTLQSEGAFLTAEDIAAHESEWVEPLSTTYRGHRLFEMPPPTQGIVGLELANIAEGYDIAALGRNTAEQIHLLVEAKKLAFIDRDTHVTDPAFHDVPVQRFISKEYAAE